MVEDWLKTGWVFGEDQFLSLKRETNSDAVEIGKDKEDGKNLLSQAFLCLPSPGLMEVFPPKEGITFGYLLRHSFTDCIFQSLFFLRSPVIAGLAWPFLKRPRLIQRPLLVLHISNSARGAATEQQKCQSSEHCPHDSIRKKHDAFHSVTCT